MKIKPLGKRLLVEIVKAKEIEEGGILIPGNARRDVVSNSGTVIDVGPGVSLVNVGQNVIIGAFVGIEVKYDDKKYFLISEDDVVGILE